MLLRVGGCHFALSYSRAFWIKDEGKCESGDPTGSGRNHHLVFGSLGFRV